MSKGGESFVPEEFLRTRVGDFALWTGASAVVIAALTVGGWAYQTYMPVAEPSGPPQGAMVIEFAEFAVSPETEELDVPEGELSVASASVAPTELEPDPEAEIVPEPEPVVEQPLERQEPPPEVALEAEEPPEVSPEAVAEPEPLPEPTPQTEPVVELEEPVIDAPPVDVPEPAVAVAQVLPQPVEPEPELTPEVKPVVEEPDPNLPMPVSMPQRVAEVRAETPATVFTPPPRRTAPPAQAGSAQTSAPKPTAQQAERAAAPQQVAAAAPSSSQVERWQSSVLRHLGQRRKFPAGAERRGERGRVVVQFTVDAGGGVQSVSLARSSGFAELDQAAVELVNRSSPIPRPPEGLPRSQLTLVVPVDYQR